MYILKLKPHLERENGKESNMQGGRKTVVGETLKGAHAINTE
jgi:hypothetical protein